MKKYLLAIVAGFLFLSAVKGQSAVDTYYFKDVYLTKKTSRGKAKYVKTITRKEDGSEVTEATDITTGQVLWRKAWKGEEPVGIWKLPQQNGGGELNYDFILDYSDTICSGQVQKDGLKEDSFSVLPKLVTGEKDISIFLMKNIRYPEIAVENNIMGKVRLIFRISREGVVNRIAVRKGVHPALDKEAVRVIRLLKFSAPPVAEGKPVDCCVRLPIKFQLR